MKDFRENIWKNAKISTRYYYRVPDQKIKEKIEGMLHKEPGAEDRALDRLKSHLDWGGQLPREVVDYITNFLGQKTIYLNKKGNDVHPFALTGLDDLSTRVLGYGKRFSGEPFEEWKEGWLIIGTQAADPFIVDLNQYDLTLSPVYHARHGIGAWKWKKISGSIQEFIKEELSFQFYVNRYGELDVKRECV